MYFSVSESIPCCIQESIRVTAAGSFRPRRGISISAGLIAIMVMALLQTGKTHCLMMNLNDSVERDWSLLLSVSISDIHNHTVYIAY